MFYCLLIHGLKRDDKMAKQIFTKEELYSTGNFRSFDGNKSEAAFPLGGIGTGNVSIGSRGEFRDWEIFNKPGKGVKLPYSFFAIWVKEEGKQPVTKVLESRLTPPFSKSHGFVAGEYAGLPRFEDVWVDLKDSDMPVEVTLEAFTPFIPFIKAVRDRHDGVKRNPWNEVECGNHYARSMASWALIPALSGYKFDLVKGELEFNPVINKDNFKCFFSCGKAWGTFTQKLDKASGRYDVEVNVLYGSLEGIKVKINGIDAPISDRSISKN